MIFRSKHLAENLGSEYSLAFQSFGLSKQVISRKIIWKAIQPDLVTHIIKQNIYLWASVITFEYINLGFGSGTVLHKILQFKDLSALVLMLILIAASIFISTWILKFIKTKFYFWKA
jgi:ABC-type nitrate/sulfonate/bicarbonate transport system permease component